MTFELFGKIIGGIGIFFIGIELMRAGFKEAAGGSLRRILSDYTGTTPRALFGGFVLASTMQSSSAVIVSMIGFLNTRVIRLKQAIVIDFGSNIGKVTTAWLIAMIGLQVSIGTFALPLIGIGFGLRGALKKRYRGYVTSVIGFAVIFLGVNFLKESIDALALFVDLSHMKLAGFNGTILSFLIGLVMTMISQSSAAAITVVLTVTQAAIIPIESACAMMVGLNLGTTFGAYVTAIKGSENGRRLAFAHIVFNIMSMFMSLVLFTVIFKTPLNWFTVKFFKLHPAGALTTFYTAFIFLGLCAMLPLKNCLVAWLKNHFQDKKSVGYPVHFDMQQTGSVSPALALESLHKELIRFGKLTSKMLSDTLLWHTKNGWVYSDEHGDIESELDYLNDCIHHFARPHTQSKDDIKINQKIQLICRAAQHFELSSDFSHSINIFKNKLTEKVTSATLEKLIGWSASIQTVLDRIDLVFDSGKVEDLSDIDELMEISDQQRRLIRAELIAEITTSRMMTAHATSLIDIIETIRRSLRELMRGSYKLWKSTNVIDTEDTRFLDLSAGEETSTKGLKLVP